MTKVLRYEGITMTNERREQIKALADRLVKSTDTQGMWEAVAAIRDLLYALEHAPIDPKDVQFREYAENDGREVKVIGTVRYATGVIVDREAIDDFGKGVLEIARSQALASLMATPRAVPIACDTEMFPLRLPPIKTGEEKP